MHARSTSPSVRSLSTVVSLLSITASWACRPAPVSLPGITINGTVAEGPLADALVTANVGGRQFTTTSAADGSYSLTIGADRSEDVVMLRARGSDTRSEGFIELASLPGSYAQLTARAGADRILTRGEDTGVDLTSGTTARCAALIVASGGPVPASGAALAELEETVAGGAWEDATGEWLDLSAVVDAAAAVRLLVEGSETLPAAYATTLALALDWPMMRAFVMDVRAAAAPADPIADAVARLAADRSVRARFDAASVPGSYLAGVWRGHNGLAARFGERFDFAASGAVMHQAYSFQLWEDTDAGTWTAPDGAIVVVHPAPRRIERWSYTGSALATFYPGNASLQATIVSSIGSSSLSVDQEVLGRTISRIAEGTAVDIVVDVRRVHYYLASALADMGITASDVERDDAFGDTWASEDRLAFTPFDQALVAGTWVMDLAGAAPYDEYYGDYAAGAKVLGAAGITFAPDGTAIASGPTFAAPLTLTWSIQPDGALRLAYPDGAVQETRIWERQPVEWGLFTSYRTSAGERRTSGAEAQKLDATRFLTAQDLLNDSGEYWQSSINRAMEPMPADGGPVPGSAFGYQFGPDGGLARVVAEPDGSVSRETFGVYEVDPVEVRLDVRLDGTKSSPACDFSDPSCIVLRRRTWTPVARSGEYLVVLESEVWHEQTRELRNYGTWDAGAQVWRDRNGVPIPPEQWAVFILPRVDAYYVWHL